MKNSVKGAIAAGAAGILLLGGAGTLAYWSDSETINGGEFTAGTLTLNVLECEDAWLYAATGGAVTRFVPGDVVVKECTFEVGASGDNLTALLETQEDLEIESGGTSLVATVAPTYSLDGTPVTGGQAAVTSADNGKTLTASIEVTFPFGEDDSTVNGNDTKDVVAALNDITITLTQQKTP